MDLQVKLRHREAGFVGRRDYNIAYQIWTPTGDVRAVMLIVPGFNSHSRYFDWAARQLAPLGIASYAVDLRGRGHSDGERFYVDSFAEYVSDVKGLMTVAKAEHPGVPVYILGHSAGGVIACVFTLDNQSELSGLICESFAFQVPSPDFVLAALKGISRIAPHARILALKNKDFSRDPAVVAAMDADPLIAREIQPIKTVAEMVRANDRLKREFPRITLPVLILHGTRDAVTKPSGSVYFQAHAGSADRTLKLYKDHFHDLLNDVGRELVISDILAWLGARMK